MASIRSTGSFSPGRAAGTHSGYRTPESRYRGGFTNQVGGYQNAIAEMQLKMMEQQLKEANRAYMRGGRGKVDPTNVLSSDPTSKGIQDYMKWAKSIGTAMNTGRFRSPHVRMGDPTALGATPAMGMVPGRGGEVGRASFAESGGRGGPPQARPTETEAAMGIPAGTLAAMRLGEEEAGPARGGDPFTPPQDPLASLKGARVGGVQPGVYTAEDLPDDQNLWADRSFRPSVMAPVTAGSPGMEKGTLPGTVPKTGKALIHKGEAVIPKAQVDRPLLHYLMEDAERKGVPPGKGEAVGGYGCGSLKGYQAGTGAEMPTAQSDEALRRFQELRGQTVGGAQPMIPGMEGTVPSKWPGYLGEMGQPSFQDPGAPLPKPFVNPGMGGSPEQLALPLGPAEHKTVQEAISQAATKADKEALTKAARDYAYGGKKMSGAAVKAAKKTSAGKLMLGLMGTAAATTIVAMERDKSRPAAYPGSPQVEFAKSLMGGKSFPGALGSALGEAAKGTGQFLGTMGEAAMGAGRDVLEGFTGKDYFRDVPRLAREAEVQNMRALEAGAAAGEPEEAPQQAAPTQRPPRKRSTREEAYEEMRGDVGYRQAKHRGDMANAEVTKLLTQLQYHGHRMDPQVKKGLLEQLQFQSKIAGQWQGRTKEREKNVEDLLKIGEASQAALYKEKYKQDVMGERQKDVAGEKTRLKERFLRVKNAHASMRELFETWYGADKQSTRNRAEGLLMDLVQDIYAQEKGRDLSDEEAFEEVRGLVGLTPEHFNSAVENMLEGVE